MRTRWLGFGLLVGCATPPLMDDPDVPGSVIVGKLYGDRMEAPGPSVVLLSSGDNPMPPEGVGLPISFSGVSSSAWSPSEGSGPMAATFAFNGLDQGTYSLNAVMDQDRNFHPEVTALATPTCGDRVGWYRESPEGGVVAVGLGSMDRVDDVLVGPMEEITEPNPVFTFEGDRTLVPNGRYRIEARAVNAEFGTSLRKVVAGPDSEDPCRAGFRYIRRDRDGDGEVDALPLLPLPLLDDTWPILIFEYLGTPVDTLGDGLPDDFLREDDHPDNTIVAIATSEPEDGELPPPNTPRDLAALEVTLTQLAIRLGDDGGLNLLNFRDLPSGAYGARLITEKGQIWTVPNEIDGRLRASRELAPPGLTSGSATHQGVWLTLP